MNVVLLICSETPFNSEGSSFRQLVKSATFPLSPASYVNMTPNESYWLHLLTIIIVAQLEPTRRPASADRTARRQFQAAFAAIAGRFATNVIAHLHGLIPFSGSQGRRRTLVDGLLESLCRFFTARRFASAVLATAIRLFVHPFVCPSVCPSVTRRYCVKTTAPSTVQFALSDSKMCLVLHKSKIFPRATPSPCNLGSNCPTPSKRQ